MRRRVKYLARMRREKRTSQTRGEEEGGAAPSPEEPGGEVREE